MFDGCLITISSFRGLEVYYIYHIKTVYYYVTDQGPPRAGCSAMEVDTSSTSLLSNAK